MSKRVLFLSPQPFFQWRGSPIRVRYNLMALSDLGYEVDLITFPFGEDVEIPGVTLHRVSGYKGVKSLSIGPSFWKLMFDFKLYLLGRKLMKSQTYAVVHGVEDAGFFGSFLARKHKTKLIYEKHSDPGSYKGKNALVNLVMWLYAKVENFTIRRADAVIATGAGLEAQVRGISAETPCAHICDIPSSLREADAEATRKLREELQADPEEVLATYVGSFATYQGIDLLFAAIPEAVRTAPKLQFCIIGGTDAEIAERRELLTREGVAESVRFLGKVNPDALPDYLAASDILLSPRISGNNTPLKLLDYLKAGGAIVATDLEANRLILNEETAVFAAPNAKAFAEAIATLALNPEPRASLAAKGRHLIDETYNFGNYTRQLKAVYTPLLNAE
ncbi:MAG: glycosyltransferase [Verrucomicrobia bacterium]|nr:glycosyltransferase [Verrucomicrobiota bacterium]MCH8511124.1 glycosyltransferase [Kiritimatiellia bacterium]